MLKNMHFLIENSKNMTSKGNKIDNDIPLIMGIIGKGRRQNWTSFRASFSNDALVKGISLVQ